MSASKFRGLLYLILQFMHKCVVFFLLLLRVRRSRRRYVALPLCAWNWPNTSDFGVGFVVVSFPCVGYLCVAGPHKFSSSVTLGIFNAHV